MEPDYKKIVCIIACKDLKNIELLPNERFVYAMHRNGEYVNYAVSNYGRVYSFYRNNIMKQFTDNRGYKRLEIRIDLNKTAYIGVHYLELMSFQPINNTEIYIPNHKDGNPSNNMLWNLEWMTISENTRHALDNGLANYKCENSPKSCLTNDNVREICSYLEQGYSPKDVANIMSNKLLMNAIFLETTIKHISRGQTYLDISRNYNIKGIKGKIDYEPEMTKAICDIISTQQVTLVWLCDHFNIPLEDRKMFCNYVRDITRRQKHTYIVNQYPSFYRIPPLPKDTPYYDWYY